MVLFDRAWVLEERVRILEQKQAELEKDLKEGICAGHRWTFVELCDFSSSWYLFRCIDCGAEDKVPRRLLSEQQKKVLSALGISYDKDE